MYVRLCEGLNDFGKLIPSDHNIYKYINNQKKDYYTSVYNYTEEQKQIFEKSNSVAGIRDVVTNKLIFDFDSTDLEKARKEAVITSERLIADGISEESIGVFFSGGKGFHLVVETTEGMTPKQTKQIALKYTKDCETFDSVVYNANRIFRVPFTKHPESGLYKTPLSLSELREMSVDEIINEAKNEYFPEPISTKSVDSSIFRVIDSSSPIESLTSDESTLLVDLDLRRKPKNLSPWKYALEQGFFPPGQRSNSLLILASTYKAMGYNKTKCYYSLKAAADLQAQRYKQDKFDKKEIYTNIINQVYSNTWEGGTYAEDTFPEQLKKFLIDLGVPRQDAQDLHENFVVNIDKGFDAFGKYAECIDENTMKFGIPDLDNVLRVQTGHLIGILAGPGIGKCHAKGTQILLSNGEVRKVENIKVGDLLMGDDSTPRKVLSLARGREQMYRIHTDDGFYDVNESHILSLKTVKKMRGKENAGVINISVKDYLGESDSFKRRAMGYRVPLEFKEQEIDFHPYLVGSWIGDGTLAKPEITHNDFDLCDYYNVLTKESGLTYGLRKNTERGKTNPFYNFIKEQCNNSGEKCIPQNYLVNSQKRRWQLLAGLIDTDGYYSEATDSYEYTCKEKNLAEQIRFLCRSLGLKATLKESIIDFEGTYYRLYINGDLTECPILLERKKQKKMPHQRVLTNYRIKVEKLEVDDYYGFEIDGNHLYCLADLTVAHNTSMALTLLNNTSKEGVKSFFASYDMAANILIQKLVQRETRMIDDQVFDVYRNKDVEEINRFKKILQKNYANVSFCFKAGQSVEELRDSIKKEELRLGEEVKLVIVDYLELIRAKSSDPTQASAEAIQGLREIANEGKVVVCLLQPNKISSKPDEPLLSYNAAKGSSAIAQAVTAMISCHRPGYSSQNPEYDNYFSINVIKNRMGGLSQVDFSWDGPTGRIGQLEDIQKQDLKELRDLKKAEKSDDKDFF